MSNFRQKGLPRRTREVAQGDAWQLHLGIGQLMVHVASDQNSDGSKSPFLFRTRLPRGSNARPFRTFAISAFFVCATCGLSTFRQPCQVSNIPELRPPILNCLECHMKQSPGKLSTEARIYAKNLAYEIARRERIGAPMLDPDGKATTWREAHEALRQAFMGEGSPSRRVKLLDAAAARIERLSSSDRGFRIALLGEGNRQASVLDLRMLVHGPHPLEGLEHERGATALCATFTTKRSKREAFDIIPSVYLSDHTIGRLRERAEQWSTPEAGFAALHVATVAADLARPNHRLSYFKLSSLSCARSCPLAWCSF